MWTFLFDISEHLISGKSFKPCKIFKTSPSSSIFINVWLCFLLYVQQSIESYMHCSCMELSAAAACPSTKTICTEIFLIDINRYNKRDRTYCWTVGHSKFLKRHVERQTRGSKEWKYEKLSEYEITLIVCVHVYVCVCQEGEKEEWEVGEMMEEKLERDFENKKWEKGGNGKRRKDDILSINL